MARPAETTAESETLQPQRPKRELGPVFKLAAGPAKWADERVGVASLGRPFLRKVFPDHWSFLLGEVALYSFIVLLLSGVFLTIWFKPSMAEVEYEGTYQLLRGLRMSQAYESTLAISFDIRGGLCSARCTTGPRCSSSLRCSPTACGSSSPAPSASRAKSTG